MKIQILVLLFGVLGVSQSAYVFMSNASTCTDGTNAATDCTGEFHKTYKKFIGGIIKGLEAHPKSSHITFYILTSFVIHKDDLTNYFNLTDGRYQIFSKYK